MKNILFVGWYPNQIDKYKNVFFQNLIFAIADLGIKCTVISPVSVMKYKTRIKEIPLEEIHTTNNGSEVKVYYPRCFSASSKQFGAFNTELISERCFEFAALKMAKKIKEKFDCVYGHFFLYGGLAATRIGRTLEIPSFIAYGECDFQSQVMSTYGMPKKRELEGLAGIISVSKKNTEELVSVGVVESNFPIFTYPNAVDLELFKKMDKKECRKLLKIPKDKFIVGFVGGFIERKGDKRVLAAINSLEGVYGAFAGVGEKGPEGDRVLFCKALKHEEVPIFLNAIDVFCLPTLSEGSCNAVAEALACGCAVVSSDLAFNDDVLTKDNSIRVNPESIQQISAAIKMLKDNEHMRINMVAKAIETSKKLNIRVRATAIIQFLSERI